RHRRPVRPLLRVLRPRTSARRGAAHLVAPVAAGRAGAAGGGAVGWNLVGPNAPDQIKPNLIPLPPSGGRARGEGREFLPLPPSGGRAGGAGRELLPSHLQGGGLGERGVITDSVQGRFSLWPHSTQK